MNERKEKETGSNEGEERNLLITLGLSRSLENVKSLDADAGGQSRYLVPLEWFHVMKGLMFDLYCARRA